MQQLLLLLTSLLLLLLLLLLCLESLPSLDSLLLLALSLRAVTLAAARARSTEVEVVLLVLYKEDDEFAVVCLASDDVTTVGALVVVVAVVRLAVELASEATRLVEALKVKPLLPPLPLPKLRGKFRGGNSGLTVFIDVPGVIGVAGVGCATQFCAALVRGSFFSALGALTADVDDCVALLDRDAALPTTALPVVALLLLLLLLLGG